MSNLKPSLIMKVERSFEGAEHPLVEVKTEDSSWGDFDQTCIASEWQFSPLGSCNTEEFNQAMGIRKEDYPVDKESLLKCSNFTGFTIAVKEKTEEPTRPRLTRGPVTGNLKTLLVVEKDDQKAKAVEPLDFFCKTEVVRATALEPDPYSKADAVWSGLEVVTRNGDEDVKYCIMSHGFGEWMVLDQSEESKVDSDGWLVDSAEIVRVKERGPYIRLSIDKEHSVFFYPTVPDIELGRIHRFKTE